MMCAIYVQESTFKLCILCHCKAQALMAMQYQHHDVGISYLVRSNTPTSDSCPSSFSVVKKCISCSSKVGPQKASGLYRLIG